MTPDTITLTLPPEREFQRVAHLVLGGLAVRLNLTLEAGADGVGLRRVLDTVVDRVEVAERNGSDWVQLTKRIDVQEAGRA